MKIYVDPLELVSILRLFFPTAGAVGYGYVVGFANCAHIRGIMGNNIRPGAVIFTGDHRRLAKFYEGMTGLAVRFTDDNITVLGSDTFELVIHGLSEEPAVNEPQLTRQDSYIKPFFPVRTLSDARERATALGGQLRPQSEEWAARGFRACEAVDPDGNVIQFRENAADA